MYQVCVVTGTRAEYGLLRPLIDRLHKDDELDLKIAVTGMHLSNEFGLTYQEIEQDGYPIDVKIDILLSSDSKQAMAKAMATALTDFTDYFQRTAPDVVVVLGDRFEIYAVATAAAICHIPIAHLHGGETTEGAEDEFFRHAISKMSYLHFTGCETYRKRVIQLGESPDRVYNVGALGVENILHLPLLPKEKVADQLKLDPTKPYALVTFHPATMEDNSARMQCKELMDALDCYRDSMQFVLIKANADTGGREINDLIDEYAAKRPNAVSFVSLGVLKYLSAMKYAAMVIGNSSSGILETPSFGIPTVNIGDRQKGRLQADSILNCKPICGDILKAMELAKTPEFRAQAADTVNPYGDGNTSAKIVAVLKEYLFERKFRLKKSFYDLDFSWEEREER